MKDLFIAEKPSVARQFADALKVKGNGNGFIENENYIITWCVGHLVTMSYPDAYDPALKKWKLDTLPFVPETYKYEIIPSASKQFNIVKGLLNRDDVKTIYVCTDSGREGEYIYRLVDMMAGVGNKKEKRRVWIDSQTEEEIQRGIREAKLLSEYDNLSDAAYLRAEEDYLMGINFSRALSLKYSYTVKDYLGLDKCVIAVGRVMTCVLGMIVKREREIREFTPTPFYRVVARLGDGTETDFSEENDEDGDSKADGKSNEAKNDDRRPEAEWRAVKGSRYFEHPSLYKENGFKKKEDAEKLVKEFEDDGKPYFVTVDKVEKKTEKKNPPLLYNLAELQNECSKFLKISPSETLEIVQELYEKKLVTYPRTDARVLSTAVAKEIHKNIQGLTKYDKVAPYAQALIQYEGYKNISKSRYVNDKQITDHYAIIPTGQGLGTLPGLNYTKAKVYEMIARRFMAIFFSPAEYKKLTITFDKTGEKLFYSSRVLVKPGYLNIINAFDKKKGDEGAFSDENAPESGSESETNGTSGEASGKDTFKPDELKKGDKVPVSAFVIKEGETSPPKRYTSGTLILAMENAGQLIEDDDLREQIKGSGIGTSATRDSIITKLINNKYISLNKKTQVVTPTFLGEIITDVVTYSITGLLKPELTASWEKGLSGVADGNITKEEYISKMSDFVIKYTNYVKGLNNQNNMRYLFDRTKPYYTKKK